MTNEINNDPGQQPQGAPKQVHGEGKITSFDGKLNAIDDDGGLFDGRFWDYVIGGACIIGAVVLAIYAAPVVLVAAVAIIGVGLILPGAPDLVTREEQSLWASIWDSTASLSENVSAAYAKLAEFVKTPIFWLLLVAFFFWYYTRNDKGKDESSNAKQVIIVDRN